MDFILFHTHTKNCNYSMFDREVLAFSYLEMTTYSPWFICEVLEEDEDSEETICSTTHLMSDIKTLSEFANSKKIVKVYLVSPHYLNNSEGWKSNKLKTILRASYNYKKSEYFFYRYQLENNEIIDHDEFGLCKTKANLKFQTFLSFS